MKNHAKVGNREGRPGYRTPSPFRYKKYLAVNKQKSANNKYFEN